MNFYCACHRSDLAMEDMEESVPELVWKSNLFSTEQRTEQSSSYNEGFPHFPQCAVFPPFRQCLYCCAS
jgi:hypothetical protein